MRSDWPENLEGVSEGSNKVPTGFLAWEGFEVTQYRTFVGSLRVTSLIDLQSAVCMLPFFSVSTSLALSGSFNLAY